MNTTTATCIPAHALSRNGGLAIVCAGLACGFLDIGAAFLNAYLQAGRTPLWLLQAVASALLGAASFRGGFVSAAFGLGLHFFVAFTVAAVFALLSRRFPLLLLHAVSAGLMYGAIVYAFMNCVTIPFASWFRHLYLHTPVVLAPAKFGWPQFAIHLTCVGLPIALVLRQLSRPGSGAAGK